MHKTRKKLICLWTYLLYIFSQEGKNNRKPTMSEAIPSKLQK